MSSEATMIKLVANDGISFRVEKAVAFKSKLIKEMWQNLNCTDDIEIHVHTANARTLRKVMEYCRKYQNEAFEPERFREGQRIHLTKDVKMYLNMHTSLLIQIFSAAHYLNIPGLVAITKQMLDDIIIEQTALDRMDISMLTKNLNKKKIQKKWESMVI